MNVEDLYFCNQISQTRQISCNEASTPIFTHMILNKQAELDP